MSEPSFTPRPETQRFMDLCHETSLEAFSAQDLYAVVKARGAKLSASINDAFRFIATWDYSRPEVINASAVNAVLRRARYTDIMDVVVAKPVGFQGNLNTYVRQLHNDILPYLTKLEPDLLRQTTKSLGQYINDMRSLSERRPIPVATSYANDVLMTLTQKEKDMTIPGNRSSEEAFGELYHNNRECVEAMQLLNTLNVTRWKHANPKDIAKAVAGLQQTTETLFTAISEQEGQLSKQVLAHIANHLELVAAWVSFFSVMQVRIIDVTTAMKHTEKTLLRVL